MGDVVDGGSPDPMDPDADFLERLDLALRRSDPVPSALTEGAEGAFSTRRESKLVDLVETSSDRPPGCTERRRFDLHADGRAMVLEVVVEAGVVHVRLGNPGGPIAVETSDGFSQDLVEVTEGWWCGTIPSTVAVRAVAGDWHSAWVAVGTGPQGPA